jgi:hypothetical protein
LNSNTLKQEIEAELGSFHETSSENGYIKIDDYRFPVFNQLLMSQRSEEATSSLQYMS